MAITISANRERDFFPAGTERLPLFEQDQSLGGWFEQVAKGLTTAEMRLSLSNSAGGVVVLDNPSSWQSFISTYLRSSLPDVTDRAVAEKLGETLGISLPNLVMFLDDVVQHATTGLVWDATRDSDVARVTRLYEPGASYANWTRYQELYNGETPTAKVATEPEASLTVDLRPAIHADIMAETPLGIFGLDRMEVEGSRDFVYSDDSDDKFAKAVSNVAWRGLDLDELDRVDWADEARVNLLLSYAGPLHLEKRVRNGETEYRLRNQPFKEIYLETEDGLLARHALSLRVRLRPEQDRGLIQMKLELPPNEVTGLPVRQKWESTVALVTPSCLSTGPSRNGDLPFSSRRGIGRSDLRWLPADPQRARIRTYWTWPSFSCFVAIVVPAVDDGPPRLSSTDCQAVGSSASPRATEVPCLSGTPSSASTREVNTAAACAKAHLMPGATSLS